MTTLAALVALLQSEVPAVDSVPTSAQYEQAVKDAVLDFSRRCGLIKLSTLAIVSGTPTYSLPADFLKLISMDALVGIDNVIISDNGIIPISKDFQEESTIANKQITFHPTPAYSLTRYFKYKAGWVATAGDYTTMGEDEAQIVLLKAKAIALSKISNAQAGDSIKYSFGAVSEDLSGASTSYQKDSETSDSEYENACKTYNGTYGTYS
jgi:hypothetical protein